MCPSVHQIGKAPTCYPLPCSGFTALTRALASLPPGPRWLCNASIDTRTRRWAVEGMAYLTLDADVKDDFVQDIPALQAMFEMAKASGALASDPGETHQIPLTGPPAVSSAWLSPLVSGNLDQSFASFSSSFYLTIKWLTALSMPSRQWEDE